MSNTLPLPEPWDYCYEWNGPFGTRKFSAASYNGNRPDRSVPIYTADQMHAHAAAVSAAKDAEIERLRAEVAVLKAENAHARDCLNSATTLLTGIHSLMYPPEITTADGRVMVFRPKSIDPHEILQGLSDRIRALPDELAALAARKGEA